MLAAFKCNATYLHTINVLSLIINLTNISDIAELPKLLAEFDTSNDGLISADEYDAFLQTSNFDHQSNFSALCTAGHDFIFLPILQHRLFDKHVPACGLVDLPTNMWIPEGARLKNIQLICVSYTFLNRFNKNAIFSGQLMPF